MKNLKKVLTLVLAIVMVLAMGTLSAFATSDGGSTATTPGTPSITINSTANSSTTQTETTKYTYWKILNADIDKDPTVGADGATTADGTVAYYVTTEAAKNAIDATGLFNVSRVGTTDKWYVELKNKSTTAEQIIAAFSNKTDAEMTAAFGNPGTMTMSGGKAESGTVDAGYYYIKSTLGSKIAVQTLSPVTINEKNEYVSDDKTIPEVDKHSQIGQEITYTLTVTVPTTANDQIVLTDTMGKGLTFKEVKSQAPIEGTVSEVSAAANDATKFTITYTADQIKALVDGKTESQTITVEVTAIVNDEAAIDTGIPNTLDLKYGNNYESKPVTVTTETTKFEFDKVDGTDNTKKLPGAEFQLKKDGTALKLIKVTEGQTYRIATAAEIAEGGDNLVDKMVTNGNTITVNGLDGDVTYQLVETKAPTGYNELEGPVEVKPNDHKFVHQNIENNKGTQLPSTGGIGTTIFYIVGSLLVIGGGIMLISRRRLEK